MSLLSLREIKAAGAELLWLGQLRKWNLSSCQLHRSTRMGGEGVHCDDFHKLIYEFRLCLSLGCNLLLSYWEEIYNMSCAWLPAVLA